MRLARNSIALVWYQILCQVKRERERESHSQKFKKNIYEPQGFKRALGVTGLNRAQWGYNGSFGLT